MLPAPENRSQASSRVLLGHRGGRSQWPPLRERQCNTLESEPVPWRRASKLGNLWRRLVLPLRVGNWSLTSLQQRLVKTGRRLIKHAWYYCLLLAEGHLMRRVFGAMVGRIAGLALPIG